MKPIHCEELTVVGVLSQQKKKIDSRAAKLVKIAHSARAARLDIQKTIRKVKFRLPAAPGQEKVFHSKNPHHQDGRFHSQIGKVRCNTNRNLA